MSTEIKVPEVGESITEVFIGEWYVPEGEWADVDQDLVGLETDKATFDVPAPVAGTLSKILKQAGETAEVGEVIAEMEEAPRPREEQHQQKPSKAEQPQKGKRSRKEQQPAREDVEPATATAPAESRERSAPDDGSRIMPAARRALAEHGLSADEVTPSGPGGRLLKEDVLRHVGRREAPPGAEQWDAREERRVRMSPIRQTIARRLVEAQQQAALLTTFNECDLSAVKNLRARYQDAFTEKYGIKLGFMSFFVKAVVDALGEYPQVAAQVEGTELVYRNYCDIGIAIGSGKGLVVPVLRSAERLSFAEIEQAIADFAQRAAANKLSLEELEGGTFTISNGGVYGSMLSTPIVNPPQSGVLGMHNIIDRPVVISGEITIRPMMYLALTYDHRVVDGREAVSFLRRIKDVIEDPTRLFLEV